MIELHPQILERDGKKEYAVLPYDEYVQVQQRLEDYEDLQLLREARGAEKDAPTLTLSKVKAELNLD